MVLGELGLILEVEVLAGAERGLEGRLNGDRWKKLLVGLADRHRGSAYRTRRDFNSCRGQGPLSRPTIPPGPEPGPIQLLTDLGFTFL